MPFMAEYDGHMSDYVATKLREHKLRCKLDTALTLKGLDAATAAAAAGLVLAAGTGTGVSGGSGSSSSCTASGAGSDSDGTASDDVAAAGDSPRKAQTHMDKPACLGKQQQEGLCDVAATGPVAAETVAVQSS